MTDKEIDDMLAMGVIEHSEAPYVPPLVLVKKPDGSYRVCVNFKELNKITVFDPEPMMLPDDIFPKLREVSSTVHLISAKVTGLFRWRRSQRTTQILSHPED